jgi:GNAT superfamily N-acetyltransferase
MERMSPFHLRPARAADLPQVLALVRALAEFEKLPGPDADAERRFTEDFQAEPPRFALEVAERAGEVIAYALYFFTYSTFLARPSLYLEDLFVRPDCRSEGLGRALLERLAAIALERGCGRFEWTVLDWNVRAQAFYRSLGARVLPEWQVCRVDGSSLAELARPASK